MPIGSSWMTGSAAAVGVSMSVNAGVAVRYAEERELGQHVLVRIEALGPDGAVGHPGEASAEGVVGQSAPVGIDGRVTAVVPEDVGQHDQGCLPRLLRRIAAVLLEE